MVLTVDQQIDNLELDKDEIKKNYSQNTSKKTADDKIAEYLKNLPPDASESQVDISFIAPIFLEKLGFSLQEIVPGLKTRNNTFPVDYALRHNIDETDIFAITRKDPHVLVELKGRNKNLQPGSSDYEKTVKQIKDYLLGNKCQSAKWGIITNSKHIQLFRKHGKVIHPATPCLEITPDNIDEITYQIRNKIEHTPKALTIAVYNNKGGVGKTTTVTNLAGILTRLNKKVLVVDFDANQRDFTNFLDIKHNKISFFNWLEDKTKKIDYQDVIGTYSKTFSFIKNEGGKGKKIKKALSFDVVTVDDELLGISEDKLRHIFTKNVLKRKLDSLKSNYDYIIIDSSPNWNYFSKSAIQASDVVLIPVKPNNAFSIQNAANTIAKYITEVQQEIQKSSKKYEFGAVALPIFFSGEKEIFKDKSPSATNKSAATKRVQKIVDKVIKSEINFNLKPFFYPKGAINKIFELPSHASISNASFERVPAVYKSKVASDYYSHLAKEYFLQ